MPTIANISYNCFVKDNGDFVDFHELPEHCSQVFFKNKNFIKQLTFFSVAIPLYNMARSIKNEVWKGSSLDPSGHVMFKVIQQGMLLSTLGACRRIYLKLLVFNTCFAMLNILAGYAPC